MELDKLTGIWEKGNDSISKKNKLSKDMIISIISEKNRKTVSFLNFNLLFYWGMQIVNLMLISMNLMGYRQNSVLFWVLVGQLVYTFPVMIYGIYIYIKNREINNFSENLMKVLERQMHFFKSHYEVWLLVIAFSTLILIFNINIILDNKDGHYLINNVNLYAVMYVLVFLIVYLIQKKASSWRFKAIKANLNDLHAGNIDPCEKFEKTKKRFFWIWVIIATILLMLFLLGTFKAMSIPIH